MYFIISVLLTSVLSLVLGLWPDVLVMRAILGTDVRGMVIVFAILKFDL